MWGEDPDILDALEEHDFECESDDDFSDLEFDDSEIAEDADEEVDEDTEFVDYDD